MYTWMRSYQYMCMSFICIDFICVFASTLHWSNYRLGHTSSVGGASFCDVSFSSKTEYLQYSKANSFFFPLPFQLTTINQLTRQINFLLLHQLSIVSPISKQHPTRHHTITVYTQHTNPSRYQLVMSALLASPFHSLLEPTNTLHPHSQSTIQSLSPFYFFCMPRLHSLL